LALDPKNQKTRDLASWIALQYPWAISETDQGYDYLILTATPTLSADITTLVPEPSATPRPAPQSTVTQVKPTQTQVAVVTAEPTWSALTPIPAATGGAPGSLCGGGPVALLLPLLAGLLWFFSRRRA